jgi:hypothetical protein
MKSSLFIVLVLLLGVNFILAGTIILDFRGEPGYNKVMLKWTTQNEINLKGFEVERGFNESDFRKIGFVKASDERKDKKEYTYEDKTVFKASMREFYYRLKIVDNNGTTSYSKYIKVSATVSSARQTWGSIKAMFR